MTDRPGILLSEIKDKAFGGCVHPKWNGIVWCWVVWGLNKLG